MPYNIVKVRNKNLYKVINSNTKKVYSKGTTKDNAIKQIKLLYSLENRKIGGAMSSEDIRLILESSYEPDEKDINQYDIDEDLSDERVKVYINKDNGEIVVAHRGTYDKDDWKDNIKYILGEDITKSKTYKYHQDKQDQVINKYGRDQKITTLGHSRGALYANELLKQGKTDEVIAVNRPLHIKDIINKKSNKLYDVRSTRDPVSFLYNIGKNRSKKDYINIPAKSYNPLKEHSYNILNRLDNNMMIGGCLSWKIL
jgi:hypothetical protein